MKTIVLFLLGFLAFISSTISGQGLILDHHALVTVAGGGKLIVSDVANGFLTIKSDATGTGSLVVDGNAGSTVSVAGHSNVELYLTGSNSGSASDMWHLVSSPISDGYSGTFLGDYLLNYDETTNQFTYIVPTNVPLTPMRGYEAWAWVPVGKTNVFSGTLNNGPQSANLTRTWITSGTGFPDYNGWNLLGNPYPCTIDIDAASGWDFGTAEQKVWIWNTSGTYKGQFATHIRGGASANGGSRYIPEEQGFFLHLGTGTSTTVTINNNVRVHSSQSYYKSVKADPSSDILRLKASGNGYNNETVIMFKPEASSSYDAFDALYYNGSAAAPRVYSVIGVDTGLCINTLPQITNNLTIPVGFKPGAPGNFTITADELNTFDPDVVITLHDLKTGAFQKLQSNPEYAFTSDTADDANRFLIIFSFNPAGTSPAAAENVEIYSYGDAVFVKTKAAGNTPGQVFVFDPIGKELSRRNLSGVEMTKITPDVSTGYYVVKVVTDGSVYSKKVFISR